MGREKVTGEMPFREKNQHRFLGAKRDSMFQNAEVPSDVTENRWISVFHGINYNMEARTFTRSSGKVKAILRSKATLLSQLYSSVETIYSVQLPTATIPLTSTQ